MKKMTKIINFLLTFALIFVASAPSFAWDKTSTGDGSISIVSYEVNKDTHTENQRSMEGRTFAAYRILNGDSNGAATPEEAKIVYSVPADMEEFYQNYDWDDQKYISPTSISSVFGKEVASADEITSMPSVFVQDNKMSDIDIMRAIAELDSQIEFVGPVDSENDNIMPIDSLGSGSTGDALRDAVLKKLNDYPNDSAQLEHFSEAVLEYLITDKKFDANTGNTIYRQQAKGGVGTNSIRFTGLPYGYYVVAELNDDGSHKHITTTLLTNVYNDTTIELHTKDVEPTVDKYIDENEVSGNDLLNKKTANYNTAEVGDIVNYRLVANLPDVEGFDENGYNYTVKDNLSAGLDFLLDPTDFSSEETVNGKLKITLFKYSDDTSDWTSTPVTPKVAIDSSGSSISADGRELTLKFNNEWIYANGMHSVTVDSKIPYIVIQYSAQVNANAVITDVGNPNSVYIEFSDANNSETRHQSNSSTVKTFLVSIDLKKADFDSKNSEIQYLEGAVFTLRNDGGEYAIDVDGNNLVTKWSTDETPHEFIVGKDGLTISGLAAGKYYLKEKTAPAGYEAIADEIEFTITATEDLQGVDGKLGSVQLSADAKYADSLLTENSSGDAKASLTVFDKSGGGLLPGTGGMGRIIIYTLGSILVIGAVVLLILKKRSAKNNI